MLDELVALAVPPRCAACRAPGRRAGDVLCGACRRALPWLTMACCERCALPLPCGRRCPARDAPFHAAWSAVAYDGSARDVMHALKFSAARPLADVMAAQIAAKRRRRALFAAPPARGDRARPAASGPPAHARLRPRRAARARARAQNWPPARPRAAPQRRRLTPARRLARRAPARRPPGVHAPRAGAADRDPHRRRAHDRRHAERLRGRAAQRRGNAHPRHHVGARPGRKAC